MAKTPSKKSDSSAHLGFEAKRWLTADKLRNNMDAAEYKHVVLGLIFLKYISDTFEEHRAKLLAGQGDYAGANPEDPDEYKAENVFWVPADARWSHLQAAAKQPAIGKIVDDAMVAIERDNPRLKGVLPKDYARPGLDKQRLGELIDLIATCWPTRWAWWTKVTWRRPGIRYRCSGGKFPSLAPRSVSLYPASNGSVLNCFGPWRRNND